MRGVRAAARYAKALLQLAKEQKLTDKLVGDAQMISNLIDDSKDLQMLLASPLIKADKKAAVLKQIFDGKVDSLSYKMIEQTVAHNRENLLGIIFQEVVNQYNKANGIAKVEVTTATALDAGLKAEISEQIKKAYNFSEVTVEESIDESLIGGMVLRIGDKQLDASIRRMLNDVKKELV